MREIRGKIIKLLLEKKIISKEELLIFCNDARTEDCIDALIKENFISIKNELIILQ